MKRPPDIHPAEQWQADLEQRGLRDMPDYLKRELDEIEAQDRRADMAHALRFVARCTLPWAVLAALIAVASA